MDALLLRAYEADDEDAVLSMLTDPVLRRTFLVPDLPTQEARHAMFRRLMEASRSPAHYERLIVRQGEVAGFLCDVEKNGDTIELGYAVRTDLHGQGIATGAVTLALPQLRAMGFRRLVVGAFVENAASFRVMEKCGITRFLREEDLVDRGQTRRCRYFERAL